MDANAPTCWMLAAVQLEEEEKIEFGSNAADQDSVKEEVLKEEEAFETTREREGGAEVEQQVINLQMDVRDKAGLTDCVSTERSIKEEPETPREAPAPWEDQEEKPHLEQLHWRPPRNPHVKEEPSEELMERRAVGTDRQGAEEADQQRWRLIPADAAAERRRLKKDCVTTNMFSTEKDTGRQNKVRPQRSQENQANPKQNNKPRRTTLSREQRVQQPEVKAKTHTCDQCGKDFGWKSHLISHQQIHSGEKPFKCDQCGKDFTWKSTLIRHQQIHSGEKPFKCDECGMCFTFNSNFKRHKVIHSGVKMFKCDQCGKSFAQSGSLNYHQLVHSGEKPHTCDECGKAFTLKCILLQHQHIHKELKLFKCDECGKTFTQSGHLSRHVLTHRGFKAHRCEQCGKTFALRSNLVRHIKYHSRAELYRCDHCGKIYKHKETLIVHLRSHTGHEVCVCDQCDKVYVTYQQLKRHQTSHSSERPHKCDTCGKSYKRISDLNRHQQVHKKKSFRCDQSGKSFSSSSHLCVDGDMEQGSSSDQTRMVTTPSGSSVGLKNLEIRLHRIPT